MDRHWPTTRATLLDELRDPADKLAWRTFVDLYVPLIYRYGRRCGLQDADAQNVVQDVLSQVTRAIRTFQYDPACGRFRNWLGLITRQRIGALITREKSTIRGIGGGASDAICNSIAHEVEAEWAEVFNVHVYRCVRQRVRPEFDRETWQAFELVWEQGQKSRDVAKQLQRKTDWVYQAKFQVLQRIKQEVTRLSFDDFPLLGPGKELKGSLVEP